MTLVRACGKLAGAASGTCALWPQRFKCYCPVSGGREGAPVGAVTGNPYARGARRDLIGPGQFYTGIPGEVGLWRAENSESPAQMQRGKPFLLFDSTREGDEQSASRGRVNAGLARWLALDRIISRDPGRLPRKGVKQSHRIPVEREPGGDQQLLPVHPHNREGVGQSLLSFKQVLPSICPAVEEAHSYPSVKGLELAVSSSLESK